MTENAKAFWLYRRIAAADPRAIAWARDGERLAYLAHSWGWRPWLESVRPPA